MITRVRIEGMTCQHCVRAVFTALAAVEGISRAEVAIGVAEIEHDGSVTLDELRDSIEVAGYRVLGEDPRPRRSLPVI
ncbi:MAG TPA: cation transporter [Gemmatimonadaceae bacterium]